MIDKNAEATHLQYLKDEKFIEWMLTPTDELITYWQHFIEEHPEERGHLLKAKELFNQFDLSSYTLPEEKKQKAVERLEKSLRDYRQRRKVRRLLILGTSSAAAILLLFLFLFDRFRTAELPADVYDEQVGMMEMVMDVDAIASEMQSIRSQYAKY